MTKICNECSEEKDISDFYKGNAKCKKCKIEYQKKFSNANKEKIKEYKHNYHINNLTSIKEKKKEYYGINKEYVKEKSAKHYSINRETKLNYQKDYASKNKENRNLNHRNRKKIDSLFKLKCSIVNMIYSSFKRGGYSKNSRTQEIIGCSYEFLKGYFEAKFEVWMTWENKGLYNGELNYGWDIDHIIPLSSAINENDLIKLNHYTNLQPLWAKDNLIKGDRYD